MATVSFSYRSERSTAKIEVRLTLGTGAERYSFYTRTQLEVSKDFWSSYKEGKSFRDAEKVNLKNEVENHLYNLETYLLNEVNRADGISKDWLKNEVKEYYAPKAETSIPETLIEYFKYYLEIRKNEIIEGTTSFKRWHVLLHKLERFQSERSHLVFIKDVNDNFINEWIEYCEKECYAGVTINNNLKCIKQICLHAQRKGIETSIELPGLKTTVKNENLPKIYLSFDELKAISELNNLPEYLDNARDWLLISCYTGQRISDFMRFDASMIRTTKGKKFIDIKQIKTAKEVTIPLLHEVEDILNKRNGNFPRPISDQRYNDYIKEVCEYARIDALTKGRLPVRLDDTTGKEGIRKFVGTYPKHELITSHVGRRSFATNFYGKLPTTYLKNITGHGTEAMLLKYIGKTSNDTAFEAYDLMMTVSR